MGIKGRIIPPECSDNHVLSSGLRRENPTSLLVTDSSRSDVNIRAVSTEDRGPTPSLPWQCARTRRKAICEVREENFVQNGVTLKRFRKYLVSNLASEI